MPPVVVEVCTAFENGCPMDRVMFGPFDSMIEAQNFVKEGKKSGYFAKGVNAKFTYLNNPDTPRFAYFELATTPSDRNVSAN